MESLPVCSHTRLPLKFKIYNSDKTENWVYIKVSSVLELETPILFGRFLILILYAKHFLHTLQVLLTLDAIVII